MPITLSEPITIPAVKSKTYTEAWVSLLTVSCPSRNSGTVRVELSAFDPATGEVKPGGYVESITTTDMMEAVADPAFPEAASLYEAVVAVVEPFRAWVKAREDARMTPPEGAVLL